MSIGTAQVVRRRELGLGLVLVVELRRRASSSGPDGLVSDVAHGADQRLVFAAELGAQSPDVNVNGPRATEEVVAPNLLQQLSPGEHPARVLGKVLQQLEFLIGQVERTATEPSGVGALVDD